MQFYKITNESTKQKSKKKIQQTPTVHKKRSGRNRILLCCYGDGRERWARERERVAVPRPTSACRHLFAREMSSVRHSFALEWSESTFLLTQQTVRWLQISVTVISHDLKNTKLITLRARWCMCGVRWCMGQGGVAAMQPKVQIWQ